MCTDIIRIVTERGMAGTKKKRAEPFPKNSKYSSRAEFEAVSK